MLEVKNTFDSGGIGMGQPSQMTGEVLQAIRESDIDWRGAYAGIRGESAAE